MNKIISLILITTLLFSFAGCSSKETKATTKETTKQSSSTTKATSTNDKSKTTETTTESSTKSTGGATGNVETKANTNTTTTTTQKSASHTHSYSKVKTVSATCTNGGYELWKCSCGAEEKRNATNALGHDYFHNINSGDYSRNAKQGTDTAADIAKYNYGYCDRCGAKDPEYAYCEELVAQGLAYIKNEKGLQIDSTVAMNNRREDFCPYYCGGINDLKAAVDEIAEMNTPKYMNLYIYPNPNSNHWTIGICAHM